MCLIWWTLRSNPFVVEVNFDVNLYISTSDLPKQTNFLVASEEKAVKNYLKCIKGLKEICKVFFMQWYFELTLLIFTVKVPSSFLQNYWGSRLQVFLSKAALKKNRKALKEKTHVPEFLFNKVAGQQNPSAQLLLNQMNIPTDVLYNEVVVMNSGKASLIVVRSIPTDTEYGFRRLQYFIFLQHLWMTSSWNTSGNCQL